MIAGGGAAAGGAFSGPVRHVYVHVPFCRARCDYCDFASVAVGETPDPELLDSFVAALAVEWELERRSLGVRRVHTLYIGGGTPSLLGPDRLERLLECFRPSLTPHAEITLEANPEDVDGRLAGWAAARRLRVSLGVQSFSPRSREALGRRSTADPETAFTRLRTAHNEDVSIDLIYGIPGQAHADIDADLDAVRRLQPEHVSWYELGVARGTPLARRRAHGVRLDEDARATAYRRVVRELGRAGYVWYEVSSFARPKHRCRHNLAYWRACAYLGLGAGAVSTVGARRRTNAADTAAWEAALAEGARPPREVEHLDAATRARERLMLAARCGLAVPVGDLGSLLDRDVARDLAGAGLVSRRSGTIRVTRKGRYVAGEVCVRLFRDSRLRS